VPRLDTAAERQVQAAFAKPVATSGTVDILMNCGGVDGSGTPVADLSTKVWGSRAEGKSLWPLLRLPPLHQGA
jgi:hypothetical protein